MTLSQTKSTKLNVWYPKHKVYIFISPLGSSLQYTVGSSLKLADTTEGTGAFLENSQLKWMVDFFQKR